MIRFIPCSGNNPTVDFHLVSVEYRYFSGKAISVYMECELFERKRKYTTSRCEQSIQVLSFVIQYVTYRHGIWGGVVQSHVHGQKMCLSFV